MFFSAARRDTIEPTMKASNAKESNGPARNPGKRKKPKLR